MEQLDLPMNALEAVFLTHHHSDHIADVGEVIDRTWLLGRKHVLPIYGGEALSRVVEGITSAYALDYNYRNAHHGEEVLPSEFAGAETRLIADPGTEGTTVYEKDGVKVMAFVVDRAPVEPALGYRVEYAAKSVVISGDTKNTRDIRQYHIDVAELAEDAAVQTLVFTHLVPTVDDETLVNTIFTVPAEALFDGQVITAIDGTRVTVPVD